MPTATHPKRLTITFDYEAGYGMRHHHPYDLAAATDRLLATLEKHHAKAVFFVTGKLVTEHPELMHQIHAAGHEIGLHGYRHEHMHDLSAAQLDELGRHLEEVAGQLADITGYRPRGFRSPYLAGPKFYIPALYERLAALGFSWVSNREIRMPEELLRPDRIKLPGGLNWLRLPGLRAALLIALNLSLIRTERPARRGPLAGLQWLLGQKEPYQRPQGLLEVPLTSPLDCDLVGEPLPDHASGAELTAYATAAILSCYRASGRWFTINCHDWITGTMDRTRILDDVLSDITARGAVEYYLPGRQPAAAAAGETAQ